MAYIGKSPSNGIRNRFIYTATAGQTSFSGSDDHNRTLNYNDAEFVDVFLNGVKLDKSDYTATSGTSVVLDEGAAVDDILEVIAFDVFSVFSGEFSQDVTVGGTLDVTGVSTFTTDVGIGTSNPSVRLEVNEDTFQIMKVKRGTSGTNAGIITFEQGDGTAVGHIGGVGSGGLQLRNGTGTGTERMRIHSDNDAHLQNSLRVGLLGTSYTSGERTVYQGFAGASNSFTQATARNVADSSDTFKVRVGGSDRIRFTAAGDGYWDGAADNGAADYAEYFEWDDGNTSDEDRVGYSVVLTNGNKIRKATSSDAAADIIGIVSGRPAFVGDSASLGWAGKWQTDDYARRIQSDVTYYEWTDSEGNDHAYRADKVPSDVTVPSDATTRTRQEDTVSSSYDSSVTYVPRSERQEWDTIGLMGKLRLRAGQPTGDRWIKMRDIATDDDGNVTVEE